MTQVAITNAPSGGFVLHIPSTSMGTTKLEVPATDAGLKIIRAILHAREIATSVYELRIGTKAQPTQSMVDAWLRANKPTKPAKKERKPSKYADLLEGIEL